MSGSYTGTFAVKPIGGQCEVAYQVSLFSTLPVEAIHCTMWKLMLSW